MERRVLAELRKRGAFSVYDVQELWGGTLSNAWAKIRKWKQAGLITEYRRQKVEGRWRSVMLYKFTDDLEN